jgi:OOP family OmpA-OmpF porin
MSKFRFSAIPLAIAAAFYANTGSADDASDRSFYLAPMGSVTLPDHERGSSFGFGGQLAFGKRVTKGLELELIGTVTDYPTKQSDFPASAGKQPSSSLLYGGGGGLNVYLAPSSTWLSGLFLHLDVQRAQGSTAPGPIRSYGTTLFDAGLGYNYQLFASGIALRFEALYREDAHGRGELGTAYGNQHQYFQEAVFDLGLRIPFGRHAPIEEAAEASAEVVPPVDEPAPVEEAAPAPPPCEPPAPGQPISLEGCKLGDTIVLHGVNFEFNKDTLTNNAKTILDGVADALKARPDIKVEVDGYTDGKGSDAYNLKLSDRRAHSVLRYLASHGVSGDRMTSKGFGKDNPIADNTTDEGREINRRVELKVTDAAANLAPVETEAVPTSGAMDTSTPAADSSSDTSTPTSAAPADAATDSAAPPADSSATSTDSASPSDSGSSSSDSSAAPQ